MATYRIISETARPVIVGGWSRTLTRHTKPSACHAFMVAIYNAIRDRAGLDTLWGRKAYEEAAHVVAEGLPGIHEASRFVIVQDIKVSITRDA